MMKASSAKILRTIRFHIVVLVAAVVTLPKLSTILHGQRWLPILGAAEQSRNVDSTFASLLLADSIVSIVQSYYVDNARVSNLYLIDLFLRKVKGSEHFSYRESKELITLTSGKRQVEVSKKGGVSYDDLLHFIVRAGELLDESAFSFKKNERGIHVVLNMILEAMDAHSSLLSVEAYKELRQGTEGTFGGLGILVGIREGLLTVIKPLPNSPAFRSGVLKNDKILSIDSTPTYGFSLDELVEHMRGAPGTSVDVSLLRAGDPKARQFRLKREVINVDSVTSRVVDFRGKKVLHAKIESFSSRTSLELRKAIEKFRIQQGHEQLSLVLDLRSNPGGLLDQAVAVSDLFLEKGVIVSTQGRHQEIENARYGVQEADFPIAILINGDSASASEIVAGALQDHDRGFIVGQPSFGKGSVQTIFELPGQRALKLTIARYYSPSGRSIQNKGIMPDVWLQPVENSEANQNLLGSYRYKNERFLANRLLAKAGYRTSIKSVPKSAYKGYVRDSGSSDDDFRDISADKELDMALLVLDRVKKSYPKLIPKEARRAGHWLALAAPDVLQRIDSWEKPIVKDLADKFDVDWSSSKGFRKYEALQLSSNFRVEKSLQPGSSVQIPVKIHNYSEENLGRVAVFLRSNNPAFDTKEVLIGQLRKKSSIERLITLTVPKWWNEKSLSVELGLAADAVPLVSRGPSFDFNIVKRNFSEIDAIVSLKNEQGGQLAGRVEPAESADLSIILQNESNVDAKDLRVKLLNLSGEQIEVSSMAKEFSELKAGDKVEALFKLKGKSFLLSEELNIGLSVESDDLNEVFYKLVKLKARPQNGKTLAH